MTKAKVWSILRATYLELLNSADSDIVNNLYNIIKTVEPIDVPDSSIGDSGLVWFDDGSYIKWDWDDGYFGFEDQILGYPWELEDPLYRVGGE